MIRTIVAAFFITHFFLGSLACTSSRSSIRNEQSARTFQSEQALAKFIEWHNRFFSGPMRPITHSELAEFFSEDIYFEVNDKQVAHSIDEMVKDYGRIKNKGHKLVNIERFDEKAIEHLNNGITKIRVKHDITMIFKDATKQVFKVESTVFIKSGKISKYIEKFGI